MHKQTVLLTGASGEVGLETFKELLRRRDRYDIRILSLARKVEQKLFKPYMDQVDIIWGDLRNPGDVKKAVDGTGAVIHVAAVIPPEADHYPELAWEVNVGGTQNLLAAMKEQDPVPRLVYTSSVSVYGDRVVNPEICVGDPLRPSLGDEYAKTKIKAEGLIQRSGLKWTILRLCGILTSRLKIQPLMFHMPLDTALEWCHSSDAGYALAEAIECEALFGRIFNLGGGKQCRVRARDFIRKMLPLYGVDPFAIPEHAFATRNFHSGDYVDGDELDRLLGFRRKNLQDYYDLVQQKASPLQRFLVSLLPDALIRGYFMRMSEPWKAVRENNVGLIERFYGNRRSFENLIHTATTQAD